MEFKRTDEHTRVADDGPYHVELQEMNDDGDVRLVVRHRPVASWEFEEASEAATFAGFYVSALEEVEAASLPPGWTRSQEKLGTFVLARRLHGVAVHVELDTEHLRRIVDDGGNSGWVRWRVVPQLPDQNVVPPRPQVPNLGQAFELGYRLAYAYATRL